MDPLLWKALTVFLVLASVLELQVRADGRDPTEMASFWAARGKKTLTPYGVIKADEEDLDREDDGDDRRSRQPPQHLVPAEPLIAALMAATADKRSAGDTPFWAARGKKDPSANFWAARGKKGMDRRGLDEMPFWAARGKRSNPEDGQEADDEHTAGHRAKRAAPRFLLDPGTGSSGSRAALNMVGTLMRNRPVRPAPNGAMDAFWAARGKKSNGLK